MKLGVSYIVFDGVELLEKSIIQIRDFVDYLQVIYQDTSWFGTKIAEEEINLLKKLKNSNLIDELYLFKNFEVLRNKEDLSLKASKCYERKKRQLGLDSCLRQNCTHYLCMDVDEFYITKEFKKAKEKIIENDYSQTAVSFINYVNLPTIHRGFDKKNVPFICKINNKTKMTDNFFVKCDKTRGISGGSNFEKKYLFNKKEIFMHHMETVRKNLFLKYESTTRKVFKREKTELLVSKILSVDKDTKKINFEKIIYPSLSNEELKLCDNIFNI